MNFDIEGIHVQKGLSKFLRKIRVWLVTNIECPILNLMVFRNLVHRETSRTFLPFLALK